MEKNWMALLEQQNQLAQVMKLNAKTEAFGLTLTEEDAQLILEGRTQTLQEQRRLELGGGIAARIIEEFCDSDYISQSNYVETILRLQEIFYLYKNETNDELTDDELLHLMKEQFETICFGDLEYLEGTGLSHFAEAVRAGYSGFRRKDGYGEAERFEEVMRWDYELYLKTLKELCWQ